MKIQRNTIHIAPMNFLSPLNLIIASCLESEVSQVNCPACRLIFMSLSTSQFNHSIHHSPKIYKLEKRNCIKSPQAQKHATDLPSTSHRNSILYTLYSTNPTIPISHNDLLKPVALLRINTQPPREIYHAPHTTTLKTGEAEN